MPKAIKKRAVKKKGDQEEGVKSVALQAVEAIRKKQQQLVIAVSVVVAVFALFISFSIYSSSKYKEAYAIETEASRYYYGEAGDESMSPEDRWKKAMELYQQSVDAKVTPSALYYLGNCYYNLADYENASKQYSRFADKFSGDTGILPLVYQKLASSYFKTGQNDKALDALAKLGKIDDGIFKDTSLAYEARHYESAGNSALALEKYRELIAGFPSSPWAAEANSRISAEETAKAPDEDAGGDTDKEKETEVNQSEEPAAK